MSDVVTPLFLKYFRACFLSGEVLLNHNGLYSLGKKTLEYFLSVVFGLYSPSNSLS